MERVEQVPLALRLKRVQEGDSLAYNAAQVRRWASMPLEDYLEGQPKAIKVLEKLLPAPGLEMCYQDAALYCAKMLNNKKTRGQGEDILWFLSFPLQALGEAGQQRRNEL